ncbi:MAG: hypothetical protein Q4P13_02985 [Psychrobacter sp.]|nr:hypothetical protein [Psychrobacter sp.]
MIIKKALNGKRVEDEDEFKFEIKDGPSIVGSFITESVNGVFSQGKDRSQVITLAPNKVFTVSESIVNSNKIVKDRAIDNYKTTYTCSNTPTTDPQPFNQSFTLSGLNYGDEITCTVTNTPSIYSFSGIVFNDNGGINVDSTANETQATSTTTVQNSQYFNGTYDANVETGISLPDLSVKLKDSCAANATDIPNQTLYIARADGLLTSTTNANDTIVDAAIKKGQYKIVVPAASLKNKTSVCLKEIEPASWASSNYGNDIYPIDTTTNDIAINLTTTPSRLNYPDNNFGEVRQNNAALILQKRQFIAECLKMPASLSSIASPAETSTIKDTNSPLTGFSKEPPKDAQGNPINLAPGLCIAYKITAINRGHVPLTDIIITDKLQTTPTFSYYLTSPATVTPDNVGLSVMPANNTNGTITTNGFVLPAASTTTPTAKSLYFNTRYGNK